MEFLDLLVEFFACIVADVTMRLDLVDSAHILSASKGYLAVTRLE